MSCDTAFWPGPKDSDQSTWRRYDMLEIIIVDSPSTTSRTLGDVIIINTLRLMNGEVSADPRSLPYLVPVHSSLDKVK